LQDKFSESIIKTLIEISPKLLSNKIDYDTRANFMLCATMALNGLIGCGVVQDWATHFIGHELTAFFGLDHGESLAVALPGVWQHQIYNKTEKLSKYGQKIWGLSHGSPIETATIAIYETENFFRSLGMPTMLSEYDITEKDIEKVCERLKNRGSKFGEFGNIGADQVREILLSRI
jgi:NADP-dependent alcohol dehydrogenase